MQPGHLCWGYGLRLEHAQVLIHPQSKQKNTVEQVNSNAPAYTVPGVCVLSLSST